MSEEVFCGDRCGSTKAEEHLYRLSIDEPTHKAVITTSLKCCTECGKPRITVSDIWPLGLLRWEEPLHTEPDTGDIVGLCRIGGFAIRCQRID